MTIYELNCANQYGVIECNGYYLHKKDAETSKIVIDEFPQNKRFSIEQHIVEHEVFEQATE